MQENSFYMLATIISIKNVENTVRQEKCFVKINTTAVSNN